MLLLVMWSLAISQACNSQDYIAFPVVREGFKMYFTTGGGSDVLAVKTTQSIFTHQPDTEFFAFWFYF